MAKEKEIIATPAEAEVVATPAKAVEYELTGLKLIEGKAPFSYKGKVIDLAKASQELLEQLYLKGESFVKKKG
ncbi:hypothetical protein [Runella zeae]|uniref:hypothetical protein n=1 Tax=Runella zeae TaxID=94255 RepID=UPI0023568D18|nr:hypothetical protein [Runella zeae]